MFTLFMMKVRPEILALVEYRRRAFSVLSCAIAILCLGLMTFLRLVCRGERREGLLVIAVVRPSDDVLYVDTPSWPVHKLEYDELPYRGVPADIAEFDFAISLVALQIVFQGALNFEKDELVVIQKGGQGVS